MTRVWYVAQRAGLTIPYLIQTEIGADAKDFAAPKVSPAEALAIHRRFRQSADTPSLAVRILSFTRGELLLKQGDHRPPPQCHFRRKARSRSYFLMMFSSNHRVISPR